MIIKFTADEMRDILQRAAIDKTGIKCRVVSAAVVDSAIGIGPSVSLTACDHVNVVAELVFQHIDVVAEIASAK